uniref:Uncharacterized protein n=1 Tax=Medicago truncatula TaxID=3880 RepID=I3SLZ4_MEDTR|nr:unknown [Medicago truncatula]
MHYEMDQAPNNFWGSLNHCFICRSFKLCTNIFRVISMNLHQLPKIKFGSFQDLNFTNENILQWVNAGRSLLNLFSNHLRDKLAYQILQIT